MIKRHEIFKFYKKAFEAHVIKVNNYHFLRRDQAFEYANNPYACITKYPTTNGEFLQWYGFFREWRMDDIPTILKIGDTYLHAIPGVDEHLRFVDLNTGEIHAHFSEDGSIEYLSDWAKETYK